jgi:hypothetical protein
MVASENPLAILLESAIYYTLTSIRLPLNDLWSPFSNDGKVRCVRMEAIVTFGGKS